MNSALKWKLYCPVRKKVSTTTALTFRDSGRTGAFISLDMIPGGAVMLMRGMVGPGSSLAGMEKEDEWSNDLPGSLLPVPF